MILKTQLQQIIDEYARRKADGQVADVVINAPTVWEMDISFTVRGKDTFHIRNLREGDLELLLAFGNGLGERSKDLFCPYPWYDEAGLRAAFLSAIQHSVDRIAASYLLECNGVPIGHFFLWAAGGNAHSREYGVELPDLGIAIADAFHGRGLGGLAVRMLLAAARSLNADGVELTTAMTNESGWNTYLHAGFEYVGILRIRLEVDVTTAAASKVQASRFRDERHMIYIINQQKREEILQYLALKRNADKNCFL